MFVCLSCACGHTHGMQVEVRGQLLRIGSVLPCWSTMSLVTSPSVLYAAAMWFLSLPGGSAFSSSLPALGVQDYSCEPWPLALYRGPRDQTWVARLLQLTSSACAHGSISSVQAVFISHVHPSKWNAMDSPVGTTKPAGNSSAWRGRHSIS